MVSLGFLCLFVCLKKKKQNLYGMLYCFLHSTIENNDLVFFVVVDLYFF